MPLTFIVEGEPIPKARPRVCMRNGHAHAYTPKKTADYEALVALMARSAMNAKGVKRHDKPSGLRIEIVARFSIPKSWRKAEKERAEKGEKRHIKKPDVDNLVKSILDGLNGVLFEDDSQVSECSIVKTYAEKAQVEVTVYKLEG